MTKQLLAVSSGEYSDYKVWAVFDDEEKATLYRDQLKLVEYDVRTETLFLNPDPPFVVPGIKVLMKRNGDTYDIRPVRYYWLQGLGFSHYGFETHETFYDKILCWVVNTDGPTQAVKVVNEIRVQLVAAEVWGDSKKTHEWQEVRRGKQEG